MKKIIFFPFLLLATNILFSQTYFEIAKDCFDQYKLACAKKNFETFLVENENDQRTLKYLGDIAVDQKDWEKAITYYKTILDADPDNADYHFKYGGAIGLKALNIGKINAFFLVDDVRDHFLEAARLDPQHLEVRWGLVEFYVHLPVIVGGGTNKALRYAKELYALSKIDGLMSQGYIALEKEEYETAKRFYKDAVVEGLLLHDYATDRASGEIRVLKSRYPYDRNQLHYQIGKATFQYQTEWDKGLAHLKYFVNNYSVKDHITKDWGYYFMAKIYKAKGELNKSKTALNKALQLRPDFKEALAFKKEV